MLRAVYRCTLPVTVRDAVRLQRELARREIAPELTDPPAACRIVVLAPHMDDEVFGCGGTLARAAAAGSSVRVVFITDGSRGYDPAGVAPMSAEERRAFEEALSATRKAEARRAGALLGFGEPVFLGLPDGRVAETAGALGKLAQAIADLAPETVFLPFPSDLHPDHWATHRLFIHGARAAGLAGALPCWGYEVWSPLVANTFVDISAVMPSKRGAMAAFASQTATVDYPRVIEALNAYRSLAAGLSHGYVEAFFVETLAAYGDLFTRTWPRSLRCS
jgi:LmbE family N-acetylglucosaminyl deacetylase